MEFRTYSWKMSADISAKMTDNGTNGVSKKKPLIFFSGITGVIYVVILRRISVGISGIHGIHGRISTTIFEGIST